MKKINISKNITYLRQVNKLSIEELAEKVQVSRQTVSKWENGQSLPDIYNASALADVFDVNLEDLLHYNVRQGQVGIPPRGKYMFGTVTIGEKGQIVIPKKARDVLKIKAGDSLTVLGDDDPVSGGLALLKTERFLSVAKYLMDEHNKKVELED